MSNQELKLCPFCGAGTVGGTINHSNECFIRKLIYQHPAGELEDAWQTRTPDPMLEELAGALEEIARCLSHGLQDCRASIIAKDMLGKYQQSKVKP